MNLDPKSKPDWQMAKEFLAREGKFTKKQVHKLLKDAIQAFSKEPNMVKVSEPAVVVGDVHGQYFDLVTLIDKLSFDDQSGLFLGDYVDRGVQGLEIVLLLVCVKVRSL